MVIAGPAVGVVVPARDEEATIGATVASVRRALEVAGVARSCVVVVADDCRDGTVAAARAHMGPGDELVEVTQRCVGAARAEGSTRALARLRVRPEGCWLLSIDADSTAPADWVARHLGHAAAGVECVAGVVELDHRAPVQLRRTFRHRYGRDVGDGRHAHVHGTNLGVRGDALLAAGGWPALRTGEDHALWAAIGDLGRRRVQDPSIRVRTSARLLGRAPLGFARDLRALVTSDQLDAELVGEGVQLGEPDGRAPAAGNSPVAPA